MGFPGHLIPKGHCFEFYRNLTTYHRSFLYLFPVQRVFELLNNFKQYFRRMFVINSDGNVIGIKNSLDDLVDFVELIGRMISVFVGL